MTRIRTSIITLACAGFVTAASFASALPESRDWEALLDATLQATDEATQETLRSEIRQLLARQSGAAPSYRHARRLHRTLHDRWLRTYDADADSLTGIIDAGRYNCLSATLLYGVLTRALGYDPEILEAPGHLWLRLHLPEGEPIEVETTSSKGFDLQVHQGPARLPLAPSLDGPRWLHRPLAEPQSYQALPLEAGVGFAWLNRGWRLLDAGDPRGAARCVARAEPWLPRSLAASEGVRRLLVRAFRDTYEAGRFDAALEIAGVDVGLFPEATTSRDRLLAAAHKRVEALCAADRVGEAEALLRSPNVAGLPAPDRARLERRSLPLLVTAAVRLGDWEIAEGAMTRFSVAEADATEVRRLGRWIELRRNGRSGLADPLIGGRLLPPID